MSDKDLPAFHTNECTAFPDIYQKRGFLGTGARTSHDREAGASAALYIVMGTQGQKLPALLQPVQASEMDTHEEVPRIQLEELHLKNAGWRIRDQALAQNLIVFNQQEKEHEEKEQKEDRDIIAQATTITSGTSPPASVPRAPQLQPGVDMDTTEKGDGMTMTIDTGSRVKKKKGSEEANGSAKTT